MKLVIEITGAKPKTDKWDESMYRNATSAAFRYLYGDQVMVEVLQADETSDDESAE